MASHRHRVHLHLHLHIHARRCHVSTSRPFEQPAVAVEPFEKDKRCGKANKASREDQPKGNDRHERKVPHGCCTRRCFVQAPFVKGNAVKEEEETERSSEVEGPPPPTMVLVTQLVKDKRRRQDTNRQDHKPPDHCQMPEAIKVDVAEDGIEDVVGFDKAHTERDDSCGEQPHG